MGQTIKIPTWANPYVVEINGVKKSFESGKEVYVSDEIAEIILRDIEAHEDKALPQLTQPRWGKHTKVERKDLPHHDAAPARAFYMSREEYEALLKDPTVEITGSTATLADGVYRYHDGDDTYLEGWSLDFGGDFGIKISHMVEEEVYEKIPAEYVSGGNPGGGSSGGGIFTVIVNDDYTETTMGEVQEAIDRGDMICCVYMNEGGARVTTTYGYIIDHYTGTLTAGNEIYGHTFWA